MYTITIYSVGMVIHTLYTAYTRPIGAIYTAYAYTLIYLYIPLYNYINIYIYNIYILYNISYIYIYI